MEGNKKNKVFFAKVGITCYICSQKEGNVAIL